MFLHNVYVYDVSLKTLKYINLAFLHVGKVLNSLNMLLNDVRIIKKGNTKIRLLTGNYILHENSTSCNLCLANAESHVYILVDCSRLEKVWH